MTSRRIRALHGILLASGIPVLLTAQATSLPAYRLRVLGVFDLQSGEPVEGAEVIDLLGKVTAKTTTTGTVTLSYLPEGETLVRIRKVGFEVTTMLVSISPDDTVPLTVLLKPAGQVLPTVFTTDSSVTTKIAPGLREFEQRRVRGGGYFITEAELRKNDTKPMTSIVRTIAGAKIVCSRSGSTCIAATNRAGGKYALGGGVCPVDVYVDGVISSDNDLQKMRVDQFAAVEFYAGPTQTPMQYNKTGSACGVMLLWTRER